MRTTGRGGQTLDSGAFDAMLARGILTSSWQARVVDMAGDPTTSSGFIHYQIPIDAIVDRTRHLSFDDGPIKCGLTLLADRLPSTLPLKQYHRLEIDRVYGGGAAGEYPYFTGVIDHIGQSWALVDGAKVRTYEVEASGMLQITQRYRVNVIAINPQRTNSINGLMVVLMRVRIRRDNAAGTGGSNAERVPSGLTYAIDDTTDGISISPNADGSAAYTRSPTPSPDYAVDATVVPATITWNNLPANTRYYRFYTPVFAGRPVWDTEAGATVPSFFKLPYGRNPFDLYWTQVSSYSTSGGNGVITPKDPTAFRSGNSLLDTTTGEYLTITDSDGTEDIIKISSVDSNGVITLNGLPTFTPAAGDPIRLSTTEMYPALDEIGANSTGDIYNPHRLFLKSGATINEGAQYNAGDTTLTVSDGTKFHKGQYILIDSEILRVTAIATNDLTVVRGEENTTDANHANSTALYGEPKRGSVVVDPAQAVFTLRGKRNFVSTDDAKAVYTIIAQADANRVEEVIKTLLTTSTSLFAAGDVTTGKTGAFIKSINLYDTDLASVLKEFKEAALPPNAFITDERDGKATCQGYTQDTVPDVLLRGINAIEEIAMPEPPTKVVAIGVGPEINKAAEWFSVEKSSGFDNINNVIDGDPETSATQTNVATPGILRFSLPDLAAKEIFPMIDRMELIGYGYFSIYVEFSTTDRIFLRDWHYRPVGIKSGTAESVTISGDELAKAITDIILDPSSDPQGNLIIKSYAVDDAATSTTDALAATVKEVRILVKKQAVHAAALTHDDTSDATYGAVPSGWAPTDTETFGTFYWQPAPTAPISYRFAPQSHLKRVLTDWATTRGSQKHQTEILELPGIALHECRDYAERYLDEYTKRATQYHVTALLDDRIERGDTVAVPFPDGTTKLLFVLAIDDSGPLDAHESRYTLIDYS